MRPNALVLIFNKDKILLEKGVDPVKNISFYRPLGGGIEFGERSLEALKREIQEEIGATLNNEKLLTVIENIFEYNGKKYHEITFLYRGEISEEKLLEEEIVPIIDKENKSAFWVSVSDIKNGKVKILPESCLDFIN
jgi:ADP-ribose pyrophosphatase YjhB (NUDIX family)